MMRCSRIDNIKSISLSDANFKFTIIETIKFRLMFV